MSQPLTLTGQEFLILFGTVCAMLLIGWLMFFGVVMRNRESVRDMLSGTSFLQNLTVIGTVITTGLLAIIGVLKGELAATLLSGIVGYVLGSMGRTQERSDGRPQ